MYPLFSRQQCSCHCSGDTLCSLLFPGMVSRAGKEALRGPSRAAVFWIASSDQVPTLGSGPQTASPACSLLGPGECGPGQCHISLTSSLKVSPPGRGAWMGELHGPPGHPRTRSWLSQTHAQDTRAYWQLTLSGALHLDPLPIAILQRDLKPGICFRLACPAAALAPGDNGT